MNKFLLLLTLLGNYYSNAQTNIINSSLYISDTNILYIGVSNKLKINGKLDIKKVKITATNSDISYINKEYFAMPESNKDDTFCIFKNKQKIFEKIFRCEYLKDPVLTLGNRFDSVISKSYILANPFIAISIPDCFLNFNMNTNILSYRIVIVNKNTVVIDYDCKSTIFDTSITSEIKKLKSGDKIIIKNLHISGPDRINRSIQPKNFIIK
jgi:GldM C-terminal domain